MKWDMAAKRAQRLLARNFASACAEAHRLGGLGLPGLYVEVEEEFIRLYTNEGNLAISLTLFADGSFDSHCAHPGATGGNWHYEGEPLPQVLGLLLEVALAEAQARAISMGQAARALAAVK